MPLQRYVEIRGLILKYSIYFFLILWTVKPPAKPFLKRSIILRNIQNISMDFPAQFPASGKKTEESQNNVMQSGEEEKDEEYKMDEEEVKQTRKRRTKAEVMREKQAKEREREIKAEEQRKKAEEKRLKAEEKERERLAKEKQKQAERQLKEKERLAKEKQKEAEREAKQKERQAKEREKQARQKEKEAERLAKELERQTKQAERLAKQAARQAERQQKQAERKAKQAQKEAERIAKQKKNNPGQSLVKWFKPATEQSSPAKADRQDTPAQAASTECSGKDQEFVRSINSRHTVISDLRKAFCTQRMREESRAFQPYYTTVYIHKSRLQFDRFLITEPRFDTYGRPHDENEAAKYDQSSVEYEDFCGDFCDEHMDEMSAEEEEEASFNSAIVADSYVSEDELSSVGESKERVDVRVSHGAEWSFTGQCYTADRYTLICPFEAFGVSPEDGPLPLPLAEPQAAAGELSLALKCDLYREIHGFYGPKDALVRKLAAIAEKIPKSFLDSLVRQTTTKRGGQRLVKPQIVEFLSEQREGFGAELQEIRLRRDEDYASEARGRMSEREKEIERLILEEGGSYYIIDLLHFLKEKGFRMTKRDLTEFIDARQGPHWDEVRKRITKMQLKEKDKLNNYLTKRQKRAQTQEPAVNVEAVQPQVPEKMSKEGQSEKNEPMQEEPKLGLSEEKNMSTPQKPQGEMQPQN